MIELTPELTEASKAFNLVLESSEPSVREAIDLFMKIKGLEPRMIDSEMAAKMRNVFDKTKPSPAEIQELKTFCLRELINRNIPPSAIRGIETLAAFVLALEESGNSTDLNTDF